MCDLNMDSDIETDEAPVGNCHRNSDIGDSFHRFEPVKPFNTYMNTTYRDMHVKSETVPVQCTEDIFHVTGQFTNLDITAEKESNIPRVSSKGNVISYESENTTIASSKEQVSNSNKIEIDISEQDEDGDTPLHIAIINEFTEYACLFVDMSPDKACLDIQNDMLQTPLHLAVLTGQSYVVRKLVARGADVTIRDYLGNTPLHVACRTGNDIAVNCILGSAKSNTSYLDKLFSVKNCDGLTCLHIAAEYGQSHVLQELLNQGADVNIGDAKSGRTVLHHAVERKDRATIDLLLQNKFIDLDCETFKGETPLLLAYWRNYQEIVQILKSRGATFNYEMLDLDISDDDPST